jgi:hypothetical protein
MSPKKKSTFGVVQSAAKVPIVSTSDGEKPGKPILLVFAKKP